MNFLIKFFPACIFGIVSWNTIVFLQSRFNEIFNSVIYPLSCEPPIVTKWIYRDNFYTLGGYAFLAIVSYIYSFRLKPKYQIFQSKFNNFLLTIAIVFLTLNLRLNPNSFFYVKKWTYCFLAILLLFTIIQFPQVVKCIYRSICRRLSLFILIVSFFSFFQNLISIYLDPLILHEGDDPNSFWKMALDLLEGKKIETVFSPGMAYFLYLNFRVFGVEQIYPKLGMAAISAVGLYLLLRFIREITLSRLSVVFTGIFYLTSSHYVSFSNMFWNENLFHPFFSIFLFLTLQLRRNYRLSKRIFFAGAIGFVAVVLTFFRSWFPFVFFVYILLFFFEFLRNQKEFFLVVFVSFLSFGGFYFLTKHWIIKNEGIFLSSNLHFNLILGHHPYSQGTYSRHWVTYSKEKNLDILSPELAKEVLNENLRNPYLVLKNFTKKWILWFFGVGGPRPHSIYYQHPLSLPQAFYRITVSLFVFLGTFYLVSKKRLLIPFTYLAITGIHLVFFADYRFTLTAMPLQAILASYGFHIGFRRIRDSDRKFG